MKNYIIIIGLLMFFGCSQAYEDVTFNGLKNLEVNGVDENNNLQTTAFIMIDNPNPYNIKIKKSNFKAFINSTEVGVSAKNNDIVLEKNKMQAYPLKFLISNNAVSKAMEGSLASLLSGKIDLKIKGTAKVKVSFVAKNFDIDETFSVNLKDFIK